MIKSLIFSGRNLLIIFERPIYNGFYFKFSAGLNVFMLFTWLKGEHNSWQPQMSSSVKIGWKHNNLSQWL
jgi:hypothetical protein